MAKMIQLNAVRVEASYFDRYKAETVFARLQTLGYDGTLEDVVRVKEIRAAQAAKAAEATTQTETPEGDA